MEAMLTDPLSVLILSHADDKLMLGHMQSDWTGLGPILEEDIASSHASAIASALNAAARATFPSPYRKVVIAPTTSAAAAANTTTG